MTLLQKQWGYSGGAKRWYKPALLILLLLFILVSNLMASRREHSAEVVFLAEGDFMPSLLQDIDSAKERIDCALYMFKTDSGGNDTTNVVMNAMISAKQRGVGVSVIFEASDQEKDISNDFNTHTGKILETAGVRVVYDSLEQKLHSKLCIIDKNIVYIGSHNYTYSALRRNSEASVRINSKGVAEEAFSYLTKLGL